MLIGAREITTLLSPPPSCTPEVPVPASYILADLGGTAGYHAYRREVITDMWYRMSFLYERDSQMTIHMTARIRNALYMNGILWEL
jgi:hypothetical protein